jgi:serine/threonine-protein kinase
MALAPDHASGHHWFALLLARQRRFEDALAHIRYAAGLDPLSRMVAVNTGWILHLSRDHEGAVRELEALTRREPGFAYGWYLLGEAYAVLGQYEEALSARGRSVELEAWPNALLGLAWVHALAGNEEEARAILARPFPRSDPLRRAQVHVALGEVERALELLEDGIRTRSPYLGELNVEPQWDPIREDPRFREILRRVGFPE